VPGCSIRPTSPASGPQCGHPGPLVWRAGLVFFQQIRIHITRAGWTCKISGNLYQYHLTWPLCCTWRWAPSCFDLLGLGAGRQAVFTWQGLALGAQRQGVALARAWRPAPSVWTCNFFEKFSLGAWRQAVALVGAWRPAPSCFDLSGLGAGRSAPSCFDLWGLALGAQRQAVLTCWGLALGAQRQAPSGARIWTCNVFEEIY